MRERLGALAVACALHPSRVLLGWGIAVAIGLLSLPALQERLDESGFLVDGSDSAKVSERVERDFPQVAASVQIVVPPGAGARGAVSRLASGLSTEAEVRSIRIVGQGSLQRPGVLALSTDRSANDSAGLIPGLREAADRAAAPSEVYVGGTPGYYADVNRLTREDLSAAERIGLPLTFAVLVVAFGSLIAAGIPLAIGVAGLATAFALLLGLSELLSLQVFVLNLAALVAFGVGVDYALLMVGRIRQELQAGSGPIEAVRVGGAEAGHAVLVSGTAVLLSLAGLLAIGIESFTGMALGTMAAVAVMIAAALTLLPTIAYAFRTRLARGSRLRLSWRGGVGNRLLRLPVQRPLLVAFSATALLLVVASPLLGITFRMPGTAILPPETESRQAAELLNSPGGGSGGSEALVAVSDPRSPRGMDAAARISAVTRNLDGARPAGSFAKDPTLVAAAGDVGLVRLALDSAPESGEAQDVVRALRGAAGEGVLIGGQPAERYDEVRRYSTRLPVAMAVVLFATALMLLLAFRSVLLPIKAVLATMLSAAAALGAVTWVFQEGHLAGLFGFQQIDGVPAFLPIFLFPIVFGLSMDYEVFLLSRIAEHRRRGASDREAIVEGLANTARIITGAAAVMISVALAFASTDLLPTQATGFGMSVAVLLDATVVRLALVPSVLMLLGASAWWWPRSRKRVKAGTATVPE